MSVHSGDLVDTLFHSFGRYGLSLNSMVLVKIPSPDLLGRWYLYPLVFLAILWDKYSYFQLPPLAETQKLRSEQQTAAQSSGAKRSQIDFTSGPSSAAVKSAAGAPSRAQHNGRGAHGQGVLGGGYRRGGERSRWG